MVIANANRIGKCNLLNCDGISDGIIGIQGMSISSSLNGPVNIIASMMLHCFLKIKACFCMSEV